MQAVPYIVHIHCKRYTARTVETSHYMASAVKFYLVRCDSLLQPMEISGNLVLSPPVYPL